MIKESLPLRVLAVGFIVLALPLLVDSFLFFQQNYEESIHDAERDLREETNYRAFTISKAEPVKQVILKEMAVLFDLENAIEKTPNPELDKQLKRIADLNQGFEILLTDIGKDGTYTVLSSSIPHKIGETFVNYIQLPRIVEKKEGDFMRYLPVPEKNASVPHLFVARTIGDKGILMIVTDIENVILPLLKQSTKPIEYALITDDGVVFAATDPRLQGETMNPLSPLRRKQIIESYQLGEQSIATKPLPRIDDGDSPFFEFIFKDKVQIAYQTSIPTLGVSFLAYSPKEAIFGQSIRRFLLVYTVYGFILLVGGGVTYWLSIWMSRPLRQLSHLMGKVGEGDLSVKFHPESMGFEINILGEIFNETLSKLLANIKRAEDERVLKEICKKELELGQEVQNSLLPQEMPKMKGVELAATYLSAEEAGGDFYDLFVMDDDQLVLTVADAAGKGISTCLYSLGVRSLLRTHMTLHKEVGTIMSEANNLFHKDTGESGMFATVLMGIYDTEKRIFSYYSCGHVSPILRKADGRLVMLEHRGMAMGLTPSTPYQSEEVQLEPGDLLLIYTNGLVEVHDELQHRFTEKRLKEALLHNKWFTANEVVGGLTEVVKNFVGTTPQDEEVVILAMRVV